MSRCSATDGRPRRPPWPRSKTLPKTIVYLELVAPHVDSDEGRVKWLYWLNRDFPWAGGVVGRVLGTAGPGQPSVFVPAAAVAGTEGSVRSASLVHPRVVGLGHQSRAAGLRLPAHGTVAVDPPSGQVAPLPPTLDVPGDAHAPLEGGGPGHGRTDRLFVVRPVRPDLVFTYTGGELALEPISRGRALSRLAAGVFNLKNVGRSALESLSRLVGSALCYRLGPSDAKGMLQSPVDGLSLRVGPAPRRRRPVRPPVQGGVTPRTSRTRPSSGPRKGWPGRTLR